MIKPYQNVNYTLCDRQKRAFAILPLGRKSLPNVVRVIDSAWLGWLRLGTGRIGVKSLTANDYSGFKRQKTPANRRGLFLVREDRQGRPFGGRLDALARRRAAPCQRPPVGSVIAIRLDRCGAPCASAAPYGATSAGRGSNPLDVGAAVPGGQPRPGGEAYPIRRS
jgi:hypothetical protein